MAEENGQERTEQATPKRLASAREEGQVARSRDLASAAVVLGGAAVLVLVSPGLVEHLSELMREYLAAPRVRSVDPLLLPGVFVQSLLSTLWQLGGFLAVAVVLAVLGPMITGGWNLSAKGMAPKLERLNPIKGLGRVFSANALLELSKTLLKFLVLAGVVVALLWARRDEFLLLGRNGVDQGIHDTGSLIGGMLLIVCLPLLLLAAVDVPIQLWQYARKLRMTRQQVKDENKDTEGRPEVKARVRRLQQQTAQRRMMEKVPEASVVVTNPTHFAVAMRYQQGTMAAPEVLAKGADLIALRIRALAVRHHIPIIEAPPLARALYYKSDLDRTIPTGLYAAVAQVLAFVFQLQGAGQSLDEAFPLHDLPVPSEFEEVGP